MKYIYIDESGDLGSKKSSSGYFVLAGVMVSKPKKHKTRKFCKL
jgi:hypothetical protein